MHLPCLFPPQEFLSFGETRRRTDEGSMPAGDPELFRNSENFLAEGDVLLSAGHFPPAFALAPKLFANGAERESTLPVCSAGLGGLRLPLRTSDLLAKHDCFRNFPHRLPPLSALLLQGQVGFLFAQLQFALQNPLSPFHCFPRS